MAFSSAGILSKILRYIRGSLCSVFITFGVVKIKRKRLLSQAVIKDHRLMDAHESANRLSPSCHLCARNKIKHAKTLNRTIYSLGDCKSRGGKKFRSQALNGYTLTLVLDWNEHCIPFYVFNAEKESMFEWWRSRALSPPPPHRIKSDINKNHHTISHNNNQHFLLSWHWTSATAVSAPSPVYRTQRKREGKKILATTPEQYIPYYFFFFLQ